MRELNYRLIVSDFDGTLIDDRQCISEKVRKAIKNYVENGGIFAVCTGRMLRAILPQVRELGLKGLVVAQQGAVIADIESGKLIRFVEMPPQQGAEICKVICGMEQPLNIFCGDTIYTNIPKDNDYLKLYESIIGVEATHVDNIAEFVTENNISIQKAAALVAESKRDELYARLCEKLGDKYDVTCSARVLVEVSPLGITKGEALNYLCKHFDIPVEKSLAIGDNLNDVPMIKAAGMGVAVANGDKRLKECADFIAVSNNDGAVAQIIEKYGFA